MTKRLEEIRDRLANSGVVINKEIDRFLNKIIFDDECWIWIGTRDDKYYGVFRCSNPRRNVYAHRYSYELFKKETLGKLFCCHKCDKPWCVNPEHLFSGTNRDNILDAAVKNRLAKMKDTHCKHGHEYTKENTDFILNYRSKRKIRKCKTCLKAYQERRKQVTNFDAGYKKGRAEAVKELMPEIEKLVAKLEQINDKSKLSYGEMDIDTLGDISRHALADWHKFMGDE